MNIDFQEILKELEYRVPNGIINLNEEHQVTTLVDILRENGVSDANELAQRARAYFGFINEAGPETIVKNKQSGHIYKVKKMDPAIHAIPKPAEIQAATDFYGGKLPVSDKDPKIKGKAVFGGKGADVFAKDKQKVDSKPNSKKTFKPSKEELERKSLDNKTLLNVVKMGLIPTSEKKLKGAGVFDPTEKQLLALKEVTEKQLKQPSYRLPLPKYDVTDKHMDDTIEIMKKELGKDFTKVKQSITKAGGVAPELTTGEAGNQRFRDIVKLYLSNGGRSVVTGEIVPFNQMQLDHHIPYSSAAKIVKEKKAKGIKTSLLEEQDRLDSPDNWDMIETPLNQLKNSLEGQDLLNRIVKKLSVSPEEKEIKKLKDEITDIRRVKLEEYFIKSFKAKDFSGITEDSLKNMSPDERMSLMKAWNYWHPNIMEFNAIMKINPNYEKQLKNMGIKPPPPDNQHHIDRYKKQGAGSRARGVRRSVPDEIKAVATTMTKAGVKLQTTKNLKATNSVLDKGRQMVEKEASERQSKIDKLKAKQKANK